MNRGSPIERADIAALSGVRGPARVHSWPVPGELPAPVRGGIEWMQICDRLAASMLLVATAPLLLALGVGVIALSGRSPFVSHLRVGQYGQALWVLKLRTMWSGKRRRHWRGELTEKVVCEEIREGKPLHDPRVNSSFAIFCRAYSLDELPQLWHVIEGSMSLVGPRPLTRKEIARYYREHSAELLSRRPGLTGLWQVSGRNQLTYAQRRKLDLLLVRKYSARLYFAILLRTVPSVLSGRGAR